MRLVPKITIGALALLLSACELKVKQAKTPPPPQPAPAVTVPPSAPAPTEPLSIPQTQVMLPRPQPLNPEALVTPPPTTSTEPSTPRVTSRRSHGGTPPAAKASPSPKPEAAETADTPPALAEAPRPRIEPLLPEDQRRQLQEEISSRLKEVEQMLNRIAAKHPSRSATETIKSFKDLSYQALEQGDIQKAKGLADRAFLLAQDLLR